jgi:hypothetical protein
MRPLNIVISYSLNVNTSIVNRQPSSGGSVHTYLGKGDQLSVTAGLEHGVPSAGPSDLHLLLSPGQGTTFGPCAWLFSMGSPVTLSWPIALTIGPPPSPPPRRLHASRRPRHPKRRHRNPQKRTRSQQPTPLPCCSLVSQLSSMSRVPGTLGSSPSVSRPSYPPSGGARLPYFGWC